MPSNPAGRPVGPAPAIHRCAATTKSGQQCRNSAKPHHHLCAIHQKRAHHFEKLRQSYEIRTLMDEIKSNQTDHSYQALPLFNEASFEFAPIPPAPSLRRTIKRGLNRLFGRAA